MIGYLPEPVDYEMYAKMDYWKFDEAIWLAVSFKLVSKTYNGKDEYTIEYEKEFNRLAEIVYRSIHASGIGEFSVVHGNNLPLLNMSYVTPYWFVQWVVIKGYQLPAEMMEIPLTEFSIADIQDKIDLEYNNHFGVIEYEIEDGENMSYSEIEEKIREMDLKAGRVPKASTTKPTSAVQNGPDNKEPSPPSVKRGDSQQYRFEKTAQSWNLQFGAVELIGVKNLVGMEYIKLLLCNPGVPVSVFEMQAMLNPDHIKAPEGNRGGNAEGEGDSDVYPTREDAKVKSKAKSLNTLKNRLLKLLQDRNGLDPDYDHMELEAIDNETARIELEVDKIRYSKDEDPEIKRNRDKISKNIGAALKNIKGLEEKKGYSDTPLFNYLDNHINTGSLCEYSPPKNNPPLWSF